LKVTRGDTVARETVLHIEVEPGRVENHMDRAYRSLVQKTRVPGFRPGKAPRSVFERFVGREYLLEHALESLVPEAVAEAVKQESLEPAGTPRVDVVEREPALKLDARVALSPEVKLGDYKAIRIEQKPEEVTDEQVERGLERIRDGHATWQPAERELRLGDLATITATGSAGGKQVMNAQGTEFLASQGSAYPVKGFSEALAGMKVNETREFSLTFPEDYSNSGLAGKQAEFTVTLNSLKEKVLPPVDDELARTVGEGLQTLADLRKRIRESLEAEVAATARRSLERQVMDELVKGASFEIAASIIDHEANHVLYDQQQALTRYRLPLSAYIEGIGKKPEDYVQEARTSAEERLKRVLVLEKLAEAEGVTVTDEQVNTEIERMKAQPDARADTDWESLKSTVRQLLRRQAALDRALEIARQDQPATPAGSGAEERK
jgi:trigger factor